MNIKALIALIFMIFPAFVNAIDCSVLEPKKPENTDLSTTGKVDSNIKGLLSKIASLDVDVDGAYKVIKNDTLKEYPNADQLYIWERLIYSYCEIIDESKLTDAQKLDRVDKLIDRMTFESTSSTPKSACVSPIQRSDLLKKQHELNEDLSSTETELQQLNKKYELNDKIINQNKTRLNEMFKQMDKQRASLYSQVEALGPRANMNSSQVKRYRSLMHQIGMMSDNRRKMREDLETKINDHEVMALKIGRLERKLKSDKNIYDLMTENVGLPLCKS